MASDLGSGDGSGGRGLRRDGWMGGRTETERSTGPSEEAKDCFDWVLSAQQFSQLWHILVLSNLLFK